MRELIDAFFRERSIVNHHIASFNDFLPTIDNPNSRMQRIVDNLRSSPEDERRGIIKLDEDRTEGDVIEIRIGRKRDERGRIDLEAKPTIFFFQAEDGIRDLTVTGVQTCALPI